MRRPATGVNDVATRHHGQSASKVPVSQHPVFPAIVALWFAALLGIGSLLLPVMLFERAVQASGLAAAVPAAEPPLGVTARILIALVAAGIGVLTGLLIARKVAAAQRAPQPTAESTPRAFDDTRSPRPILAHEELGAEGFDEPVESGRAAPIPGRRRALSLTDEGEPSLLLDSAPLPGKDIEIVLEAPTVDVEPEADEALELDAFTDLPPVVGFEGPDDAETDAGPAFDASRSFDEPEAASGDVPPVEADARFDRDDAALAPASAQDLTTEDRPLGDLSISELVERFALSLQRSNERAQAATEEAVLASAGEAPPAVPRYVPDLGVEAIEAPRFAAPADEPEPGPAFASAQDELPAALRPVRFDEVAADDESGEDHDDLALTLSLAREGRPFDSPGADEVDEVDEVAEDAEYTSLLNMRRSIGETRETIRIDDEPAADGDSQVEPVVVFPGQDLPRAASPGHTESANDVRPFAPPAEVSAAQPASSQAGAERALRDALQKLQRLSGAA